MGRPRFLNSRCPMRTPVERPLRFGTGTAARRRVCCGPPRMAIRCLLRGDLNPGNVLAAHGCSWVAIDPKPWVGDPAFDLAQLLLNWVDDDPTGSESVETVARGAELLADRL